MTSITPIQQLLLDCLHRDQSRLTADSLSSLDHDGWHAFLALAKMMQVRPLVLDRLSRGGFKPLVFEPAWEDLQRQCRPIAVRALYQQAELRAIVGDLAAANVPVIVLKGADLRQSVYRSPVLREMGDLDIMVHREHLKEAADVVTRHGYESLKAGAVDVDVDAAVQNHLPRYVKRGITAAEVHWNLTMSQAPYAIDPADLWRRARPFPAGAVAALALSPEDLLLHLCLHASYQHEFGFGLRWACDVDAVTRHFANEIDWNIVTQRAATWKWARGVYAALRLAHDLVGADVPGPVLNQLRPRDGAEDILETARTQTFTNPGKLANFSTEMARLEGPERVGAKVAHLYRRVTLSPVYLAAQFAVPLDSPGWLFAWLRVRRLVDLLVRYRCLATDLFIRRDAGLTAIAHRKNWIRGWLTGC